MGPDQTLKTPGAAAVVARNGDRIEIAPGAYFDCAIWTADDLTVIGATSGTDAEVVLTDKACEGKAAFVTRGRRITLSGLTFTRIRVPDRNGAGIRAEGEGLTVERSRFVNNQIGILASDSPEGAILVRDCTFTGNGVPDAPRATADLLIGRVALLRVEQSRFEASRGGPSISTRAVRTELTGDSFAAVASAPMPYVIGAMDGGDLVMQDTAIELAGVPPGLGVVAVAGAPGEVALRGTMLRNRTGLQAVLLRDWGSDAPTLERNAIPPGDVALSTDGATLHRLKTTAHEWIAWLRAIAGQIRHAAAVVFRSAQALLR